MGCSELCLLSLVLTLCIWSSNGQSTDPPPYLSHAGRAALETTIRLPVLQYQFPNGSGADVERRNKVKDAIKRTWDLYVQQAWGWDEVRPVRGSGQDTRFPATKCMLKSQKWMGGDNCRWAWYSVHRGVKWGTGICIGLCSYYRLHISRRFG